MPLTLTWSANLRKYGPAIAGHDLNNAIVGGANARKQAYRFRAAYSSTITNAHYYTIGPAAGAGYGGGSGGTLRLELQSDDGTGKPSGTVLATAADNVGPTSYAAVDQAFGSPYMVTAGVVYHLVWTNVDADPVTNYASLDLLFVDTDDVPWQPLFADADWAHVEKIGAGAWSDERGAGQGTNTPILDITYGNGSHQGMGYMETWGRGGSDGYISCDGTKKYRETFTVSGGDRLARAVYVKVAKVSGTTGDLTIRLEDSAGTLIEAIAIPAEGVYTHAKDPHGVGQGWVGAYFAAPHTLTNGSTYRLVLSTTSGEYWTTAIRRGSANGYAAATYFGDGNAQIATDGSTWTNALTTGGVPSTLADLQFYLLVS